jgi:hypothetical protein
VPWEKAPFVQCLLLIVLSHFGEQDGAIPRRVACNEKKDRSMQKPITFDRQGVKNFTPLP